MPTPHGVITVRAEQAGPGFRVHIALPAAVAAEVRLPLSSPAPTITGSPAEVQTLGAEHVITLPPGAHASISA